jgi:hypothetical protein
MEFLDKNGLKLFLNQLKNIFGSKYIINRSIKAFDECILNVDYENELAFNTDIIVSGAATSAVAGIAMCGTAIVGNS